jgi:hypothetical protein
VAESSRETRSKRGFKWLSACVTASIIPVGRESKRSLRGYPLDHVSTGAPSLLTSVI